MLKNLQRLISKTKTMGKDNGERQAAERIAHMLPISTATSIANLLKICESRSLYSRKRLIELGLSKRKEEKTDEEILGTDRAVFFFCAPFAYPDTDFGLLFKPEMESAFSDHATASPFDSGGLLRNIYHQLFRQKPCFFPEKSSFTAG